MIPESSNESILRRFSLARGDLTVESESNEGERVLVMPLAVELSMSIAE